MDLPTDKKQIQNSQLSLKDLPFHQLYEKDTTQMSELELREFARVLRENTGSGTARKAAVKRQEKILTGKTVVKTTMDDYL